MTEHSCKSWRLGRVAQAADRTLDAWSVYEVPFDGQELPWTAHLTGFSQEGCTGRVSTAVVVLDPFTRRATTRTGRVYHLAGQPGFNADALAVWGAWRKVNRIVAERDITLEVAAKLAEAGSAQKE